jgi:hypothetical protein
MTERDTGHDVGSGGEALERALARVVDRRDGRVEWSVLESAALHDTGVWTSLADSLRQESELRAAGDAMAELAGGVELPGGAGASGAAVRGPRRRVRTRTRLVVAAVVLLLAWLVGRTPAPRTERGPAGSAESLGELVPVVVERRATGSGDETELLLIRRYLERAVVPRLYELGLDENETPIVQPVWDAGASEVEYL